MFEILPRAADDPVQASDDPYGEVALGVECAWPAAQHLSVVTQSAGTETAASSAQRNLSLRLPT